MSNAGDEGAGRHLIAACLQWDKKTTPNLTLHQVSTLPRIRKGIRAQRQER